MSAAPVPATFNLGGVLWETRRIIKTHSRHFLALSVLFLLPLAFSLIVYRTFLDALASDSRQKPTQTLLRFSLDSDYGIESFVLPLIYVIFVFVFSLFAVGTVSYSIYHGFYGRPVKLVSAVKSLAYSFLPLVATTIASELAALLVCACCGLFVVLTAKGAEFLGFEIDYKSNYVIGFCIVVFVILILALLHLRVNWALAPVIVVVESKWGFEPLRRSTYLVRGMRLVSMYLLLLYGSSIGFMVWSFSSPALDAFENDWKSLAFIVLTVVSSSCLVTMCMLSSLAAKAVLYMYCKALHGELAWEIAEEFAREYVSLPFDDAKVPYVVYVAEA